MNRDKKTGKKQLTQEQNRLILDHLDYAKNLARKINYTAIGDDDIDSAAMEGLCRAALNYDGREGVQFSTYLYMYVFKEVNETIRQIRGTEAMSVDDEYPQNEDGEILNPLPEPIESPFERMDETGYMSCLMDGLEPFDREILDLRYGMNGQDEHTFSEIARMLGLSRFCVKKRHDEILKRLRGRMSLGTVL